MRKTALQIIFVLLPTLTKEQVVNTSPLTVELKTIVSEFKQDTFAVTLPENKTIKFLILFEECCLCSDVEVEGIQDNRVYLVSRLTPDQVRIITLNCVNKNQKEPKQKFKL